MDYKDTLLMPKTDFPMRGNLPNREPDMQKDWEEQDIYRLVQERTKDRPKFVLHDDLLMQTETSTQPCPEQNPERLHRPL